MPATSPLPSFAYRALTPQGQSLAGTVEAGGVEDARARLAAIGLRVLEMEQDAKPKRTTAAIRGDDFVAFNQQLAHLASAGLPLEQGLRLIAAEMRGPRQRAAVAQVAAELEKGVPLADAFARHAGPFPPLYGKLLNAGVRANNLPGVLLNLGRHAELVARLRAALWRSLAYPATVMAMLLAVLWFISVYLVPQFVGILGEFRVELPAVTQFLVFAGPAIGVLCAAGLALMLLLPLAAAVARRRGRGRGWADRLALRLPLVGPVLRRSLVARWCDALHLGVSAGMDLPAAIDLAGEVVGSPRLTADGRRLSQSLAAGDRLDERADLALLPPAVPAALQLAGDNGSLPDALATLAQMYQQQAELRLAALPAILTPLLLLLAALLIGFAIVAAMMPLFTLLRAISGG